jgi:phosphoribosylaminoimidazole carboxylase
VDVVIDGRVVKKKVEVQPSWKTLRLIQDKYLQKEHLAKNHVAVAEAMAVEATVQGLKDAGAKLGYPFMLKARNDAYDGRGNFVLSSLGEEQQALDVLRNRELYAEKWAKFKMELAVMVVKTWDGLHEVGSTTAYPAVHTIHEDSICKLVYAPAPISLELQKKAQELAREAVSSLWGKGVFGVELFLMEDGKLILILAILS